jgi:integrase
MATYQKRAGKWRAIVRRKGHVPVSKTFTNKAMAERWARETERSIEAGSFDDPKQLERESVGGLIRRHRKEMPAAGRTKAACLNMLEREIGSVTLSDLTKQRIIKYCDDRATKHGAGPATIAQDLIYLHGLLKVARAHWDIPVNLAAVTDARAVLKERGIIGKSDERERRPTDAEIEALLSYWDRPMVRRTLKAPMGDLVLFAIASSMRLSEITAIRWGDIDEADRTIVIRDRKHPTKKAGNDQVVPLLGAAWSIVQRQPRTEDPRIFPFNPKSVSTSFTRAVLRTRIDDLHFHDLRHEGISRLFEAGYGVHEVALVSGHRDWKQLKRYTQIRAKDLHREPVA